jgi:SNF2 family DNA or RNA helicase
VFPSHSYEQYYQLVRRCYRFGQTKPVKVASIVCEGESGILPNLQRKQGQANKMFDSIVKHMADSLHMVSLDTFDQKESVPSWL